MAPPRGRGYAGSDFVAGVSHDLRSPLATIRAATDVLLRLQTQEGPIPPNHLATALGSIRAAERHLGELIDSLNDRHARETGCGRSNLQAVDVRALADEAVEAAQALTPRQQILIKGEQAVVCTCDPPSVRRVLANLLDNAIKYSPQGGEIVVSVMSETNPGGAALICVTDQGIGIPPGDLARVFDPAARGGNVQDFPGEGIGLATCQQLMRAQRGSIGVKSEVGVGSTFVIRVPTSPPRRP